jgi:hypothetical protein
MTVFPFIELRAEYLQRDSSNWSILHTFRGKWSLSLGIAGTNEVSLWRGVDFTAGRLGG